MFEAESRTLAAANANLERAALQLAKATADVSNADHRIADLSARKAEIAGRRVGGIYDRDDGFDLAEIAVDLDGLTQLRATFAAGLDVAAKGHQAAVEAVGRATWALGRVKDEAAEVALLAHTKAVFKTLGDTLSQLDVVSRRLGRGQVMWAPDAAIVQVVRKADLQRGNVR